MANIPLPWSPSKLACYEQCPRQAKYKFVDKLPDPGSAAMQRGNEIHGAAEDYIRGLTTKVHPDLKKVRPMLLSLRKGYIDRTVRVELALGFDKQWKLLPDWFHDDTWLRIKVDVLHFVSPDFTKVIDWKTGKLKEGDVYDDAMRLYAIAALSAGFGNETVAQLVFTDFGKTVDRPAGQLSMTELPKARREWDDRVKKMTKDKTLSTRPGFYCRWCTYSRNKGGPCEF